MKIKLLLFFLFAAIVTNAQLSELYNKSEIINRSGKFYELQTVVYADSSIVTRETPLGDTTQLFNRIIGAAIQTTREYAAVTVTAARKGIVLNTLQALDSALIRTVGISVRDTIKKLMVSPDSLGVLRHAFEGDDYQFFSGAQTDAAVIRQANGNLRFRPNVAQPATTFGIIVFGDRWIRVNAYPSAGSSLDFFLDDESGLFISDTRTANGTPYRLRKASLVQSAKKQ